MSTTTPNTVGTPTTDHAPDDDTTATDRAATASDRLWAALHARPGGTADELSGDAGIGRSTAAKILARWAADGTATRLPSDGKRSASRYAVPAYADATEPDGTADDAGAPSGPTIGPNDDASIIVTVETDDAVDEPDRGDADDDAPADDATTGSQGTGNGDQASVDATGSTLDAIPATDDGAATTASVTSAATDDAAPAGSIVTGEALTDDAPTGTERPDAARAATAAERGPRLSPGALHGMVEDYLRDHPGEEFGPTKIGHDLSRSTGAVGNALERLVTAGYAVRTKDRPKRYALAPATRSADDDAAESVDVSGA